MKTLKDLKLKDNKKLAELSEADMKKEIQTARSMLYSLEMKKDSSELKQTHLIKFARRYIATALTFANKKGYKVS